MPATATITAANVVTAIELAAIVRDRAALEALKIQVKALRTVAPPCRLWASSASKHMTTANAHRSVGRTRFSGDADPAPGPASINWAPRPATAVCRPRDAPRGRSGTGTGACQPGIRISIVESA